MRGFCWFNMNGQTAAIIGFRLQLLGYDVTPISAGEDVPAEIDDHIPDLVLVDTRLPGIDGFEVISRIRAHDRSADVPVLACSPDSSPESVQRAFLAGADDYLIIPFDPAILESKIETLLSGRMVASIQG